MQIQDQGYQAHRLNGQNEGGGNSLQPHAPNYSLFELKHQNKHNLNDREKLYKERVKKHFKAGEYGEGTGAPQSPYGGGGGRVGQSAEGHGGKAVGTS